MNNFDQNIFYQIEFYQIEFYQIEFYQIEIYQNIFVNDQNVNLIKAPSKSTVLHRREGDHEIKFYIFEKVV